MDTELHYFNYKLPTLDEDQEEIIYHHPDYPIYCNQIGTLFVDEDLDSELIYTSLNETLTLHWNRQKLCKQKLKLIYECYTGETKRTHTLRNLDGNPYNTTYGNVVYDEKYKEIALLNFMDFQHNSVSFMMKRDLWLKEREIEPCDYWSHFKLPNWLRIAYGKKITKIWEKPEYLSKPRTTAGGRPTKLTPKQLQLDERARLCRKKVTQGDSIHKIMRDLGLSRNAVNKALERVLPEDI